MDISPEAVERVAFRCDHWSAEMGTPFPQCDVFTEAAGVIRELRLQLTASEKRVAELVAKYETDDPIKPTALERQQWLDGECGKAVRAYRERLNCGLREAVDAMKGAT